jgi:excisionase family DNA binding protein
MATYTTKEAAERLGLEVSHVRRLLEEGKIRGKKWGRDWMVTSLDYQRKRRPKTRKGERDGQKEVFEAASKRTRSVAELPVPD